MDDTLDDRMYQLEGRISDGVEDIFLQLPYLHRMNRRQRNSLFALVRDTYADFLDWREYQEELAAGQRRRDESGRLATETHVALQAHEEQEEKFTKILDDAIAALSDEQRADVEQFLKYVRWATYAEVRRCDMLRWLDLDMPVEFQEAVDHMRSYWFIRAQMQAFIHYHELKMYDSTCSVHLCGEPLEAADLRSISPICRRPEERYAVVKDRAPFGMEKGFVKLGFAHYYPRPKEVGIARLKHLEASFEVRKERLNRASSDHRFGFKGVDTEAWESCLDGMMVSWCREAEGELMKFMPATIAPVGPRPRDNEPTRLYWLQARARLEGTFQRLISDISTFQANLIARRTEIVRLSEQLDLLAKQLLSIPDFDQRMQMRILRQDDVEGLRKAYDEALLAGCHASLISHSDDLIAGEAKDYAKYAQVQQARAVARVQSVVTARETSRLSSAAAGGAYQSGPLSDLALHPSSDLALQGFLDHYSQSTDDPGYATFGDLRMGAGTWQHAGGDQGLEPEYHPDETEGAAVEESDNADGYYGEIEQDDHESEVDWDENEEGDDDARVTEIDD